MVTGEDLYNAWADAMADERVSVDVYDEVGPADVAAWDRLAVFVEANCAPLRDALRAYSLTYPCPGFEVAEGAGEASGCAGPEHPAADCPTCETTKALA